MIYADFNATTPLCPGAISEMKLALETWGNPSSTHQLGRKAQELLEKWRQTVAGRLGVPGKELVFTSGGSESNTMAIWGSRMAVAPETFRLLTSKVEHSSVRDTVKQIESTGSRVEFVKLYPDGTLDLQAFSTQLNAFQPHLVSLMTANNETGILFPIPQIAELCTAAKIPLHTDAVQAFGKIPASFFSGAALISVSAHKVHGPKGSGALVVRGGQKLVPTHYGGSQEVKRRGGTENMVGISGFAGACRDLHGEANSTNVEALRDRFEGRLVEKLETVTFHGKGVARLPNTSNIRFNGVYADVLLSALDLDGVCVSAGSACSSGSITPSHVLLEMGLPAGAAKECLRFSWSDATTAADIDSASEIVINHVLRIRSRKRP